MENSLAEYNKKKKNHLSKKVNPKYIYKWDKYLLKKKNYFVQKKHKEVEKYKQEKEKNRKLVTREEN